MVHGVPEALRGGGAGAPEPTGCITRDCIVQAVLAELSDFIDPPMVSGITVPPNERLWIARRVADRVLCPS
jgi:hypothetical protein